VRLVLVREQPVEEIAAEPDTLRRLAAVLDRVRDQPAVEGRVLAGGRGLLALPLVADPTIPPLTVVLRPYSTPTGAASCPPPLAPAPAAPAPAALANSSASRAGSPCPSPLAASSTAADPAPWRACGHSTTNSAPADPSATSASDLCHDTTAPMGATTP
jgi:hypothetical protein